MRILFQSIKKHNAALYSGGILLLLFSCASGQDNNFVTNVTFPYDLRSPVEKFSMPPYLSEISGISWKNGKILCVQDERGTIYSFDPARKEVIGKTDFGPGGDYEDIAAVGEKVYVLKSNGDIIIIESFESSARTISIKNTPLSSSNNSEGLAYDNSGKSLLIACKDSPYTGHSEKNEDFRAIFSLETDNWSFGMQPLIRIRLKDKQSFADLNTYEYFMKLKKKGLTHESAFKPSGIAIHPRTSEIYVISASGHLVLVLDRNGRTTNMQYLDPIYFRQPEGICFSSSGDLFISNEGRGDYGNILRFSTSIPK